MWNRQIAKFPAGSSRCANRVVTPRAKVSGNNSVKETGAEKGLSEKGDQAVYA